MSWDGIERREIPIHFLNFVEERIATYSKHIEQRIDEQEAHISKRCDDLTDLIQKQEARLQETMNLFQAKQTAIDSAFLHDDKGRPDYVGHFHDHDDRKSLAVWLREQRNKIAGKAMEYIVLLFLAWVAMQVWERAAYGPNGQVVERAAK